MQDERKITTNIFWRQSVSIRHSDIKTPAQVSILKRAVLNQAFSPHAQSNFSRRDLQFVMSQIEENNFVVQTSGLL